jgi:ankyrin repeat protein
MKKIIYLSALVSLGACMKYTPVKKVVVVEPPRTPVKPAVPLGELSIAAGLGDTERMQKLIDDGADVNELFQVDGMVLTPLMVSMAAGETKATEFLIAKGANVNLQVEGVSLKEIADELGKPELVKLITAKEVSILAQEKTK